jgi:gliding motility-associated-like protein
MYYRSVIILLIGVFSCLLLKAQDRSNRGKEFWLGYGFNYKFLNEVPANDQELALYISTEQAATVTLTINGTSWTQTLNIPANTADASILIPKSGPNDARVLTDGFSNKGIHIVSDVPVAVYAHVYGPMVSGATMLMPVETYGFSYHSINYYQTTSQSNPPDWYSWFYVIASEDGTRVQITPSDSTKNGWLPGQTYTVNLNKGEMYHVFGKAGPFNTPNFELCSKDMTGSKVISIPGADGNCHPVAVFSGSGGIRLCRGDGGEFVHQQVFPSQAWGTRYLTYHTINNTTTNINETNRNYYRVCVQDPTTIVRRNGTVLTGLIKNFFYEFMDSTGGDYIESDKPILVSQYTPNKNQCWNYPVTSPGPPTYGDPEMFYLSPIEQGQKSVLFYVSRKSSIDYVYANIHLPTTAINSLRVDGNPVPAANIVTHPNLPSYSVAVTRFTGAAAQHTINCDSTFTSTVYGLGLFESYGYNVGTLINNLNFYGSIKNVYNTTGNTDTFTCPKSPVRLFLKTGYPATSIHWKLSQVPGLSPNTDSIINNPVPLGTELINGRTYYTYTLQQDFVFSTPGTYYIPVTYTATVIENCSQSENATIKVVVKPGPKADFSFPSPACLSDSVHFLSTTIAGSYNLVSYNWLFDDNSTANTIDAVKLYTASGDHPVRYTVYADNGCIGDTTKTVTISPSPTATFTVSGNICQRDSVLLTSNASFPPGTVTSWYWNFGDGNTATYTNGNPFYHRYNNPGTYPIYLITTASNGCKSDTSFGSVTVLPKPTALFSYDGNICTGDSILITDNSSPVPGFTITGWQWNFGDGNSITYANNNPFYHPYTTAGNYPVSLVVSSSNGCASDTFRLTVNVSSKPAATFTINGKPCIDSLQSFISSIPPNAGNPPTWNWSFGDGQTFISTSSNVATHAYTIPSSNILVKHWVSYSAGCSSDTSYGTITQINTNPVASFTITGDTFCVGRPITLNSPVTGVSTWNWKLGTSNSNAAPPFTWSFSSAGNQTISLDVKTAAGCGSAPVSQSIVIGSNPVIDAGPDKFIRLGTSTTLDASIGAPANYDFTWRPAVFLNDPTLLNPVSTPDVQTKYIIRAMDKITGCYGEDETLVTPVSEIYIPTAFTPNNDGKNDRWEIPGLALYPDAQVSIFNRWGQKIFETKNYTGNPWNGVFKGIMQPHDSYVYIVQLNDDKKQQFKGMVTLIR